VKSLKNTVASFVFAGLFLVACGEDGSSAPQQDDDSSIESSSSERCEKNSCCSNTDEKSSSSSAKSSSSVIPQSSVGEKRVSSSSSANSSSSVILEMSRYGTFVDERDGQTYNTVKIGDQVWMAENLNYAYLQSTDELDSSSFCYNDSASYCEKYGRLYLWSAAMDSAGVWSTNGKGCGYGVECSPKSPVRGVCPQGWHLPSKTEWNALITIGGYASTAGIRLKSTSGWISGNGKDVFSFSALPAGIRRYYDYVGDYYNEGFIVNFWSSTESDRSLAYFVHLSFAYDNAKLYYDGKRFGISIRCLKD